MRPNDWASNHHQCLAGDDAAEHTRSEGRARHARDLPGHEQSVDRSILGVEDKPGKVGAHAAQDRTRNSDPARVLEAFEGTP